VIDLPLYRVCELDPPHDGHRTMILVREDNSADDRVLVFDTADGLVAISASTWEADIEPRLVGKWDLRDPAGVNDLIDLRDDEDGEPDQVQLGLFAEATP